MFFCIVKTGVFYPCLWKNVLMKGGFLLTFRLPQKGLEDNRWVLPNRGKCSGYSVSIPNVSALFLNKIITGLKGSQGVNLGLPEIL